MPTPADSSFWHPFADMASVRGAELVIERGRDVWVWDEDGRRYLDATASLWYANVGHGRPEIAAAVAAQLERIEAYSAFGDLASRPALALCERLAAYAPMTGAKVFLGSGGGDGVETAAKLARLYWDAIGQSERRHVISRTAAYHGIHGFGTSIAGIPANRAGYGTLVSETSVVAHDSIDALHAEIERLGAERVAAFFMEPVIGAGGVHAPPEGYLEGVAAVCRDSGVLVVADSVISGFGRLGTWFGIERWPEVRPDLIIFAKGVTSGYLPLGGVVVDARVAEPFWSEPGARTFRHGVTYAGHATCCAAALANLDILEHEGLLARGEELEGALHLALEPLAAHPLVDEVRAGTGLLGAVALAPDLLSRDAGAPVALAKAVRRTGVLVRPLGAGVAVSPPLTIQPEHLELIASGLQQGLDELHRGPARGQDRQAEEAVGRP
jgi:adenosylmethionine-8-amino-7-oxononanoate aminotransferase